MFGAVFAGLLLLLFAGEFIQGQLFPKIVPMGDNFAELFVQTRLEAPIDRAKLLIWSFMAGFAERLVPNALNRLTAEVERPKEKSRDLGRLSARLRATAYSELTVQRSGWWSEPVQRATARRTIRFSGPASPAAERQCSTSVERRDLVVVDEGWSRLPEHWCCAFRQAWAAYVAGTIPVGAVVVDPHGVIVAEARNRIFDADDPPRGQIAGSWLAHAELNAIAQIDAERSRTAEGWAVCAFRSS